MVQNRKYKRKELEKMQCEASSHIFAPLPLMFVRGKGVWLEDMDGHRYLDCLSAYGAVNQGHCHRKIYHAMLNQAKKLTITSAVVFNDKTPLFYKKLRKITGFESALQMNSGSEAVEVAIKIMRKWGYLNKKIGADKAEIIVCRGNYHGRTTTIDSISSERKRVEKFSPFTPGFKWVDFDNLQDLEMAINENTCGFLVEPIQCENGIFIPHEGYLKKVSEICKRKNIILCIDEIQVGLGRTGKLFCFQHDNIIPDMVTIGKSLSGGFYPISAVLSNKKIMDTLVKGDHGGTFVNNPLSAVVGIASLGVIINEKLSENANKMGLYLIDRLKKDLKDKSVVEKIWGKGLLVGVKLNKPARDYCAKLWSEGIFCKYTHSNIIRIMPPLIIKKQHIDFLISKFKKCLK